MMVSLFISSVPLSVTRISVSPSLAIQCSKDLCMQNKHYMRYRIE